MLLSQVSHYFLVEAGFFHIILLRCCWGIGSANYYSQISSRKLEFGYKTQLVGISPKSLKLYSVVSCVNFEPREIVLCENSIRNSYFKEKYVQHFHRPVSSSGFLLLLR